MVLVKWIGHVACMALIVLIAFRPCLATCDRNDSADGIFNIPQFASLFNKLAEMIEGKEGRARVIVQDFVEKTLWHNASSGGHAKASSETSDGDSNESSPTVFFHVETSTTVPNTLMRARKNLMGTIVPSFPAHLGIQLSSSSISLTSHWNFVAIAVITSLYFVVV